MYFERLSFPAKSSQGITLLGFKLLNWRFNALSLQKYSTSFSSLGKKIKNTCIIGAFVYSYICLFTFNLILESKDKEIKLRLQDMWPYSRCVYRQQNFLYNK